MGVFFICICFQPENLVVMILNKNIEGSFPNITLQALLDHYPCACTTVHTYKHKHTYACKAPMQPANSEAHLIPVLHELTLHVIWAH